MKQDKLRRKVIGWLQEYEKQVEVCGYDAGSLEIEAQELLAECLEVLDE